MNEELNEEVRRAEGGDGQGGEEEPELNLPPPGLPYFIGLMVVTILINLAVVWFFDNFTEQRLLSYEPPGTVAADERFSWARDNFFTTIFFGCSGALFFVLGIPAAAQTALNRHVPKGSEFRNFFRGFAFLAAFLPWCTTGGRLSLAVYILFLVACGIALVKSDKKPVGRTEWAGLAYLEIILVTVVCMTVMGYRVGEAVQQSYVRVTQRGAPIIESLGKYREEHGDYPEGLGVLVPEYLAGIPTTGLAGHPKYDYQRDPDVSEHYILHVSISHGMSWEDFWYWPEQDYDHPEKPKTYNLYGKRRIDGWLMTWGGT